jgi:hypothetical protein
MAAKGISRAAPASSDETTSGGGGGQRAASPSSAVNSRTTPCSKCAGLVAEREQGGLHGVVSLGLASRAFIV